MKHVLSKAGLWITLATIAIAGCTTLNQDEEDAPLLRAINRSDEVLQDVMIRNVDSHPQHFGIVGQGHAGEKTLQVQIRFDKAFVIGWHANGSHGARQLDLSKYEANADRIKSVSFSYLGKGEWSVVARDANEKEIKPSAPAPVPHLYRHR